MTENARNTITIKGEPIFGEALASGTIKPGHLIERTSAAADTVIVHQTSGGRAMAMFAIEDDLQGNDIDDSYLTTVLTQFAIFRAGDEVLGWIANGEDIAKNDDLISAGTGELKESTPDSSGTILEDFVVARAREACDMSDSSSVDPSGRCIVEIQ